MPLFFLLLPIARTTYTLSSHQTFLRPFSPQHKMFSHLPPSHHRLLYLPRSSGPPYPHHNHHQTPRSSPSTSHPRRNRQSSLCGTGRATTSLQCVRTCSIHGIPSQLWETDSDILLIRSGRPSGSVDAPNLAATLAGAIQEGQGRRAARSLPPVKTALLRRSTSSASVSLILPLPSICHPPSALRQMIHA